MTQMYKVEVKTPYGVYFPTREEAAKFARGEEALIKPVTMRLHHSSLSRGFLGTGEGYRQAYNGRFGRGYVQHYPTRDAAKGVRTNNYHLITYYIEQA